MLKKFLKSPFPNLSIWYTGFLFEVKCHFVSNHFADDADKLFSTVPKGNVVGLFISSFGFVISFESGVVFKNIVSCIYKDMAEAWTWLRV